MYTNSKPFMLAYVLRVRFVIAFYQALYRYYKALRDTTGGMQMATQQRNFRVPDDIESDIHALRLKNESVTQCYLRVIRAGIAVIKGQEHAETVEEGNPQLVEALQSTIDMLKEQLSREHEQIVSYREQLTNALELVSQEQTLRLVEAKRSTVGVDDDGISAGTNDEQAETPAHVDDDAAIASDAHIIEESEARPLTFGEALRYWMNKTPVKVKG